MASTALTTSSTSQAITANGWTLEAELQRFVSSQDVTPSSRRTYLRSVRQFFRWVDAKGYPLASLTRVEVLQYREELLAKGMSSLSVGGYLTSVRRFYAWAEGEKVYPNIARDIKGPKRKQQFRKQALTAAKAKELLSYQDGQDLRDHAILNLLLRTGLRTIEVVRANVEDITSKAGTRVLLVHGKGRSEKDAFVIVTDTAYQPIADYLATRGKVKAGEPLFTSASNNSKGGRLSTRTVSGIAKHEPPLRWPGQPGVHSPQPTPHYRRYDHEGGRYHRRYPARPPPQQPRYYTDLHGYHKGGAPPP
jgi:integrase/recombinase XerD